MNTKLDYLFRVESPWIAVGAGEAERVKWTPTHFYSKPGLDVCTKRLRGNKMRHTQGLMDEFSAAFQFFDDFGENWIALRECLTYLDEWIFADVFILVVERAECLLADEQQDQMKAFLKTLNEVGDWWSRSITNNDRFNRKAIPFHVLLNTSQDKVESGKKIIQLASELNVPIRA